MSNLKQALLFRQDALHVRWLVREKWGHRRHLSDVATHLAPRPRLHRTPRVLNTTISTVPCPRLQQLLLSAGHPELQSINLGSVVRSHEGAIHCHATISNWYQASRADQADQAHHFVTCSFNFNSYITLPGLSWSLGSEATFTSFPACLRRRWIHTGRLVYSCLFLGGIHLGTTQKTSEQYKQCIGGNSNHRTPRIRPWLLTIRDICVSFALQPFFQHGVTQTLPSQETTNTEHHDSFA